MNLLNDPADVKQLAEQLSSLDIISKMDLDGDSEAWKMAIAFADISDSFARFNDELLPELVSSRRDQDIKNVLVEIGDEFRHVIYHVFELGFYAPLRDLVNDELSSIKPASVR